MVVSKQDRTTLNVKRFRAGLVFKDHRLVYHPPLGWRVIKKRKKKTLCSKRGVEQDKDDTVVAPLMSVIDVLHAIVVITSTSAFGCVFT